MNAGDIEQHIWRVSCLKKFFLIGFTQCKAEQPLQGKKLQEKEVQKGYSIQEISLERTYS